MMGPYHIATQTQYGTLRQAGTAMEKIGYSEADAIADGFVFPIIADRPEITASQRAVPNALPTEQDGQWVYGWTVTDVPPTVEMVNTERQRRVAAGDSFTVAGITDPIPLQGRPFDQTVYLALLTRASGYKAAGVTTPVLTIRDGADTIHTLTPDQMISLISQAMTWFESVMATSWAMKDATGDFPDGIPADFTDDTHWP